MQYVICYDIPSDRSGDARRSRVANALLDFGARVQESVFVANLDEDLAARLQARMRTLIDANHDRLHVFSRCAACQERTWTAGSSEVPEDQPFYVL